MRLPTPRPLRAAAALCLVLVAGRAAGQPAMERAMAFTAFNEGMALYKSGQYPAACAKLEESLRLDAQMGTRFWLADCYEHVGRTASAWGAFLVVADDAGRAGNKMREDTARARADALAPGLSRLTVVVPEAVAATPGIEVRRDESAVGRALWGTAVPVDPGPHRVRATAPGKEPWEQEVAIAGHGATVTVPALRDAQAAPARDAAPPRAAIVLLPEAHTDFVTTVVPAPPAAPPPAGDWHRPAAIAVGSVGVAAVVAGAVTGVLAFTTWHDATSLCAPGCTQAAADKQATASTYATVSTATFVVGGAAVAGALALWLTAPRPKAGPTALYVAPAAGGLVAGGSFR